MAFCCTVQTDPPYAQDNQTEICPPQDSDNTQVNYGAQCKTKEDYLITHVLSRQKVSGHE